MKRAVALEAMGRLIRETFRAMIQRVERQSKQTDIVFSQWLALKLIDEGEGTISCVTDLNRELGIRSGAATRLVDRLVSRRLLRRCRSGTDRRVIGLELTDEGQATILAMQPRLATLWSRHLAMFSERERQELMSMLTRLRDGLLTTRVSSQESRS